MAKKQDTKDVSFQHEQLVAVSDKYIKIQDAIDGSEAIKNRTDKYLPIPSLAENNVYDERYVAYLKRAVYYNVCKPTRDAIVGQLFLTDPVIDVPDALQPSIEDINGEGLTLVQLIKQLANYVLPFGRGGLLVDFPQTSGEITKAQIQSGEIKPTIRVYEPWSIINWRVQKIGTKHKLTLLVLAETYEKNEAEDEFRTESDIRHRVYRREDGNVTCQLYLDKQPQEKVSILMANGNPLTEIPFVCIGSENNDFDIDEPPFNNLATLNIAHFCNSADYEESVFITGQPTPVFTGLTQEWMERFYPNGIMLGSRSAVTLPTEADAKLLQAEPNQLAFEAMDHKEGQMISIGAKIVNRKQTVERKEAEIQVDAASQRSVLTTVKDNIQLGIVIALKWANMFVSTSVSDGIKVEINGNFDLTTMTSEELRMQIELYSGGLLCFSDVHSNLRRSGLTKRTDEEAKKEIAEDMILKKTVNPDPEPKPNPSNSNLFPSPKPKN